MKIMLTAIALLLATSTANAVDLRYWQADEGFVRKLGTWYEEAPAAFKARLYNPIIVVATDADATWKIQRTLFNASKSDAKFARDGYAAMAYKGVSGYQNRGIVFKQYAMLTDAEEWQHNTVLHEMSHLFDYGPSSTRNTISDGREFTAAFQADKRDWEAWLSRLDPQQQAQLKSRLGYFFSNNHEAFAEASARLIRPLRDLNYLGHHNDFIRAFPRVNAYVKQVLIKAGVPVVEPAMMTASLPPPAVVVKQDDSERKWPSQTVCDQTPNCRRVVQDPPKPKPEAERIWPSQFYKKQGSELAQCFAMTREECATPQSERN
jgi:hypothetical protein